MKAVFVLGTMLFMVPFLMGCNAGGSLGKVHGVVRVDGQTPPPGLQLEFLPRSGATSRVSFARVGDDGRYTASYTGTRAGVPIGEVDVRVVENEASMTVPNRVGQKSRRKFTDNCYQSIATLSVVPGDNEYDLELTSVAR